MVVILWEYRRNTVGILWESYGNTIGNLIGNPVEYCWNFMGILVNNISFFTKKTHYFLVGSFSGPSGPARNVFLLARNYPYTHFWPPEIMRIYENL